MSATGLVQTKAYLPPALSARLRARAAADGLSVSAAVAAALTAWLGADAAAPPSSGGSPQVDPEYDIPPLDALGRVATGAPEEPAVVAGRAAMAAILARHRR